MDNVHGVDIDSSNPIHHAFEFVDDVVKVEIFTLHSALCRGDLFATDFVPATVDCVEETLGKVGTGAEELHLLSHQHGGHTTSNGSIISPRATHDLITFELDGTGVDRYLGNKVAKRLWQTWRIPDREVGLRSGTQIVKSL